MSTYMARIPHMNIVSLLICHHLQPYLLLSANKSPVLSSHQMKNIRGIPCFSVFPKALLLLWLGRPYPLKVLQSQMQTPCSLGNFWIWPIMCLLLLSLASPTLSSPGHYFIIFLSHVSFSQGFKQPSQISFWSASSTGSCTQ